MSIKPVLIVVACALIDMDNRVLVTSRPQSRSMAGMWEFPGGKIESGETPEQALKRELKEELGITTFTSCLAPVNFASHNYKDFHLLMPLYICRKWEGTLQPMEDQKMKWVRPVDLHHLDMPPADKPLIHSLIDLL
ncbi:MAG: 8-oxo-dGTP diphosphatase MutT [Hyphomicrobiales bacterium]|nr:8-oxo-dGTP diphosphatase MutT [Hyphomicrobiales bacterium]